VAQWTDGKLTGLDGNERPFAVRETWRIFSMCRKRMWRDCAGHRFRFMAEKHHERCGTGKRHAWRALPADAP